jgi:peptidoglycan hydrolase-like protein with peptidoglycan-binding domain
MAALTRLVVVLSALLLVVPVGAPAAAASTVVAIQFPTVGSARYTNDYLAARGSRTHHATDLFAPAGSPVYAARAGRVVWAPLAEQAGAGFALQIKGDDGRTYAYYHLGRAGGARSAAVASGVKLGSQVARGQRIGVIGDSGNAAGSTPHLHFEMHRANGDRMNPYPSLVAAQGRRPQRASRTASGAGPTGGSLRIGDRGAAVATWQRDLNRTRPGNPIETDGVFGPRTERATAIFQRQVGLGPSGLGVVGQKTRAALTRYVRGQTSRSSAAAATPSGTALRLGSRGSAVAAWQRDLNRVRGARLGADGAFGPLTHAATVAFQRAAGLGPAGLGVVGPRTRAAMARAR